MSVYMSTVMSYRKSTTSTSHYTNGNTTGSTLQNNIFRDRDTNHSTSSTSIGTSIGSIPLPRGVKILSATSTITMSVPDSATGSIIGKKGSSLVDIQARSGAKVSVAPR